MKYINKGGDMKKVLIVEDVNDIRELLELVFKLSGYKKVYLAKDGESGIEIAKKTKPDLIVMDVKMPGKYDGIKALKIVKNEPELSKCKVAILSANCQKRDIERGFNAGADAYFFKPFSPVEFMSGVETLFKKRQPENIRLEIGQMVNRIVNHAVMTA